MCKNPPVSLSLADDSTMSYYIVIHLSSTADPSDIQMHVIGEQVGVRKPPGQSAHTGDHTIQFPLLSYLFGLYF